MDFDQWKIGNAYTPNELTKIVQDAVTKYRTSFAYGSGKSSAIQKANSLSEICSQEELMNRRCVSLELEFLRRSLQKKEMNYLWLKFSLIDGHYRLHSSIKSRSNMNYLRQKSSNSDWEWDI